MTDHSELIRRARQLAKVQFSETLNGLCDGLESDKALIADLVAALEDTIAAIEKNTLPTPDKEWTAWGRAQKAKIALAKATSATPDGPHVRDRAASALESLSAQVDTLTREKEALAFAAAEAYQAVGMLAEALDLNDDENVIRLLDVLAYGKTQDGKDLLPFPLLTHPRISTLEAQLKAFREAALRIKRSANSKESGTRTTSIGAFDALMSALQMTEKKDGK